MCLIADKTTTEEFLAKLKKQKKNWFYIYKPVQRWDRKWLTLFQEVPIPSKGWLKSDRCSKEVKKFLTDGDRDIPSEIHNEERSYSISKGIHGFLNHKDAKKYMGSFFPDKYIMRFKAYAEDLVAVGFFEVYFCPSCVVMQAQVCPIPKKSPRQKK